MEVVDRLLKKIQHAADELVELRTKNRALQSEVDVMRRQLRDYQDLIRENERNRRTFDKIRGRLVKLHKKVERAMIIAPVGAPEEGDLREEHPQ